MAHFVIEKEARHPVPSESGHHLCLQWGFIEYGLDAHTRRLIHPPLWGYRFIQRRPNGSQIVRGAALILSRQDIETVWKIADDEGWGKLDGEAVTKQNWPQNWSPRPAA